MATLERVMQMKSQGISDDQIAQSLRQEGIAPREIEESLSQSKIKSAVDSQQMNQFNQNNMENQYQDPNNYDPEFSKSSFDENQEPPMQPEQDSSQIQQQFEQPAQEYYPEYQPQSTYQEYQPQQQFDLATINEILEQTIEEKNDSLKKQISSFSKFKEDMTINIEKLSQRLQKIEDTINNLQMSIIRKIGDYGNDIHSIAREMQETQGTFSKIIDPLTDNIRELKDISDSMKSNIHHQSNQISQHQTQSAQSTDNISESSHNSNQESSHHHSQEQSQPSHRHKKSKDGFENFLR